MKIKPIKHINENQNNDFISTHNSVCKLFQLLLYFPFSWNKKVNSAFTIVSVLVIIFVVPVVFFWTVQEGGDRQSVNTVATKALVLINLISVWVHLVEAKLTVVKQAKIYSKLNEIDQIYHSYDLHMINYDKEKKQIKLRFIILIVISTSLELLSLGIGERLGLIRVVYVIADIFNYIRCAQILCFIEFVSRRIRKLKKILDISSKQVFTVEFAKYQKYPTHIESMKLVKNLYGKLHGIFILVNNCFGWSLLFVATFFFLDFTWSFYWLYLRYDRSESVFEALYSILPKATLLLMFCSTIKNCNEHVSVFLFLLSHISNKILTIGYENFKSNYAISNGYK